MAWTYILECNDGNYYVGSTRDLEGRVHDHNRGLGSAYTRTRLPVRLLAAFEFDNIGDAYGYEKRIQKWSRAKKQALIEGRFVDINRLNGGGRVSRRPWRASSTNEGGGPSINGGGRASSTNECVPGRGWRAC